MAAKRTALVLLALPTLALYGPAPAWAESESPIYSFKGPRGFQLPAQPLLVTPGGASYGVLTNGGKCDHGQIYKLSPPANGASAWSRQILYQFGAGSLCENTGDGAYPAGNLVAPPPGVQLGPPGIMFGTTQQGGAGSALPCNLVQGCGTVFALVPPGTPGGAWTESVIYAFSSTDGPNPLSLTMDSKGNLYGTTPTTVFNLVPGSTPEGTVWYFSLIYVFGTNPNDGGSPNPNVLVNKTGVLYGTTQGGGSYGGGTIYTLTPPTGNQRLWTYAQIYGFGGVANEGTSPNGGLIGGAFSSSTPGTYLWGTTHGGGANGLGTIFSVGREYLNQQYSDSVIYSFAGLTDGSQPLAGLFQSDDGSYWGTTSTGGGASPSCSNGCGTVFTLAHTVVGIHSYLKYRSVADFTGSTSGDGSGPFTTLAADGNGSLYGLTSGGGTYGEGTAFTLPDAVPVYTVAEPTFSPKPGGYTTGQTVTIADATAGATIYYTTDGGKPTAASPIYTAPLIVNANETIKAVALLTGWNQSSIASGTYTIEPRADKPAIAPKPGTYTGAQTVTISESMMPAIIYYTTDGTDPTQTSQVYTAPITVGVSETVKAIAVVPSYLPSPIASAAYTIQ